MRCSFAASSSSSAISNASSPSLAVSYGAMSLSSSTNFGEDYRLTSGEHNHVLISIYRSADYGNEALFNFAICTVLVVFHNKRDSIHGSIDRIIIFYIGSYDGTVPCTYERIACSYYASSINIFLFNNKIFVDFYEKFYNVHRTLFPPEQCDNNSQAESQHNDAQLYRGNNKIPGGIV